MEQLKLWENNDYLGRIPQGILFVFSGQRRVVSTSVLNGGIQDKLKGVFNYNCLIDSEYCELEESSYEKQLESYAITLGLDPREVTGMATGAWMEYVSIKTLEYHGVEVTAVVTAGIDHNATRAGDPAMYEELQGAYKMLRPGTINIILYINKNLPAGTMERALVVCTEAKVAAIQELLLESKYSSGIATGSGTDGTIIIADMEIEEVLTDAGTHAKLGELIGSTVKEAVKEALNKQTSAGPAKQRSVVARGRRYGLTFANIWEEYCKKECYKGRKDRAIDLERQLEKIDGLGSLVTKVSMYVHLLDQFEWGMLMWSDVKMETTQLCIQMVTVVQGKEERYRELLNKRIQMEYECQEKELQKEHLKQKLLEVVTYLVVEFDQY